MREPSIWGQGDGRREGGDGVLGRWRLRLALLVFVYVSVWLSSARLAVRNGTRPLPDAPCACLEVHVRCFGKITASVC